MNQKKKFIIINGGECNLIIQNMCGALKNQFIKETLNIIKISAVK